MWGGPQLTTVPCSGPTMAVLLGVQKLTRAYGVRPLFNELSLDLRAGERIGLVGSNCAGKSALLKILVGR